MSFDRFAAAVLGAELVVGRRVQIARAQMPRPARHRGSSGGHSVFTMHVFEHRMVSVPSTHSALAQSFSPAQVAPAGPVPRAPGMQ